MEEEPEASGNIHTQLSQARWGNMCVGWHLELVSHSYKCTGLIGKSFLKEIVASM